MQSWRIFKDLKCSNVFNEHYFNTSHPIAHLSSPGIGSSLTGGEGYQALELLPPGDQLPRSRRVEEEEEADATTGAKASAWGTE